MLVSPIGARLSGPPGAGAPGALPPEVRVRALEFQRQLDETLATRVETTPWGAALFRDDLPRVTDLNLLRCDTLEPGAEAQALMAETDRLQAGLPHRAVRVLDGEAAARMAPAFAASGWLLRRTALMVQRRMRDRPVDTSAVQEVEIDSLRSARQSAVRHEHRDLDVGAEVLAAGELAADGVAPRAFAAIVSGQVSAYCLLRSHGGVAKITEAEALARSSGRGEGRAVIAQTATEARRAGASVVFVEAEDEEWAKWTYHRMGFDEAGKVHLFVRPWGD
jgi:hypothetical protein